MRTVVVAALLLLPAPAFSQDAQTMDALRRARALYSTPMSTSQVSEMLSRAIYDRPGWKLLRKDGGNTCPTPYAGVSVSCDWIINESSGWGYDVVQDVEGAATIVQSDGVPNGAGISTVAPWPVGTTPQQPQQPATGIDYDRIRVLVGLEVQPILTYLANMQDNDAAIRGDIAAVSGQVKAHDEKTSKLVAFLTDGKTISTIVTFIGTWLALRQVDKP